MRAANRVRNLSTWHGLDDVRSAVSGHGLRFCSAPAPQCLTNIHRQLLQMTARAGAAHGNVSTDTTIASVLLMDRHLSMI